MPGPSDYSSVSIPISPPPPQDLSSYSRFMHDHTKRQMEAQGAFSPDRSGGARKGTASGSSSMTNGRHHRFFPSSSTRKSDGSSSSSSTLSRMTSQPDAPPARLRWWRRRG